MKCRKKYIATAIKCVVVLICLAGFLYQSMMFMFFYWTYPTVVDIQVTSPSFIELPAFTFCNHIGYNLDNFCKYSAASCPNSRLLKYSGICNQLPMLCKENGTVLPDDFTLITYRKYSQMVQFGPDLHEELALMLDEYLECEIEFAGETRQCNMENVMGSFYSTEELPHYCFTIYSKWGQPNATQEKVEKGAIMKFHFNLNVTKQPLPPKDARDFDYHFRFNPPSTAAVQIAVHSPYYLPSPFLMGSGFIGGRSYEIGLKQEEKHLLPAPYQTNCTDYMSEWYARGGKAPVNQLTVIQECKLNHSLENMGCVPLNIDYPHAYNICKPCGKTNLCDESLPSDNCTLLAENYNQPCDFISYEAEINQKIIIVTRTLKNPFLKDQEGLNEKLNAHECGEEQLLKPECSIVDVEVVFERFEITNLTYNPKYESMETFSVIGGYMGMWLGISLVAVYDFFISIVVLLKNICATKLRNKKRRKRMKQKLKEQHGLQFEGKSRKFPKKIHNANQLKQPSIYSTTYHY